MGRRTSVYLDDDLHAAFEASGVPLAELIRRGLASDGLPAHVTNGPSVTAALLAAIPPGEPCPASPAPGRAAGTATRPATACAACPVPRLRRRPHRSGLPARGARERRPRCPARRSLTCG